MEIDFSIHPDVTPLEAYNSVRRASGRIAAGLRRTAIQKAKSQAWSAHRISDGTERHKAVKATRDVLRYIDRMEVQRRGWKR
jgi:hypothetical protein